MWRHDQHAQRLARPNSAPCAAPTTPTTTKPPLPHASPRAHPCVREKVKFISDRCGFSSWGTQCGCNEQVAANSGVI